MDHPTDMLQAHLDMVYGTCMRVLGNAQDAADATQEVAMQWLTSRSTIRTSTAAWLHAAAHSKAVDMVRRREAQRRAVSQAGRLAMVESSVEPDVDGGLRGNLDAALADLAIDQRALLLEHHLEGHDLALMAERRGTSRMTISRRLTQARELLGKALAKRGVAIGGSALVTMLAAEAQAATCPSELVAQVAAQMPASALTGGFAVKATSAGWVGWGIAAASIAVISGIVLTMPAKERVVVVPTKEVTIPADASPRASAPSPAPAAKVAIGVVAHGQDISVRSVGRVGAASEAKRNYAPNLETVAGDQVYASSQTLRNQRFTGMVLVTGGEVTFEFCSFEYAPAAASAQLQQYHDGRNAGRVVCNWCDFDTGLRGTTGHDETCNVQFGERGLANRPTVGSRFTLYRCRLAGCGNGIGIYQYRSSKSDISECLISSLTHTEKNNSEGLEIRSSDNITMQGSRIEADSVTDRSCLIIAPSFGTCPSAKPIVIRDCFFNGGEIPIVTTWYSQEAEGGPPGPVEGVQFINNRFGDASRYGRVCNFDSMDVTRDPDYALANPRVIYWASSNVWAPNGETVASPGNAPSGDVPAGLPHVPGESVDQRNFFGGSVWKWNGKVVP